LSSGIGSGNQALGGGTGELIFESDVGRGLGAVISGGDFWSGFGTGLSMGVFNHTMEKISDDISETIKKIVKNANKYVGSTAYNPDDGIYKSNKFVYDVLVESDADPGTPNGLLNDNPYLAKGEFYTFRRFVGYKN
jgi:hypothetical protein